MVGMKVKTRDDIPRVLRAAKRAKIDSITRAAAYTRTVIKRKIGRRKSPRAKGQSMTSPTGRGTKSIVFAADRKSETAIIGPTHRVVGRSLSAHEHGGKYKGDKIAKRPFAEPGLEAAAPKLDDFWRGSLKK